MFTTLIADLKWMKIVKEVPERFITTHSFQNKESSVQYDTFYAMWNINKARRVKGIPSWSHVQCFQWTKPLDAMFSLQTNLKQTCQNKEPAGQEEDLREEVDVENPLKPCLFTGFKLSVCKHTQSEVGSKWPSVVLWVRLGWSCPAWADASNLMCASVWVRS